MVKVLIESPYAGDIEKNVNYARLCMLDCLRRGEAPFASHLLYTQCLDDSIHDDRSLGITAGLEFGKCCDKTVVYCDFGISVGMQLGIDAATKEGRIIEYRRLFNE